MRHLGHKGSGISEGYVDESIKNKRRISHMITSSINLKSASSNVCNQSNNTSSRPNQSITNNVTSSNEPIISKTLDSHITNSRVDIVPVLSNQRF